MVGRVFASTRRVRVRALLVFALCLGLLPTPSAAQGVRPIAPTQTSPLEDAHQGSGRVAGPTSVHAELLRTLPALSAQESERLDQAMKRRAQHKVVVPEAPSAPLVNRAPNVAATSPSTASPRGLATAASPNDLVLFRTNTIGAGLLNGRKATTDEPSVSNNGNVVFYTGNVYAAVSTDSGLTFGFINPFQFPSSAGGMCCDQVTIYDPSRDITIWVLQYDIDGAGNNIERVAVARGKGGLSSNTWFFWDFSAQSVGFASGNQLDYPQAALSSNFFYLTTNVFNAGGDTGTTMLRLPLDTLASGGTLNYNYYSIAVGVGFTPVSGASSTMYWARHLPSSATLRVYSWPETGSVSFVDVPHSASPVSFHTCPEPDSFDMCGFDDSRLKAGWVAGGVLGFAWDAPQGSGGLGVFPYPYIQTVRVNQFTGALINEPIIWNSANAWAYPSIAVNQRGHLGLSAAFGGGPYNAGSAIGVWDDISSTGWSLVATRYGTNGPGSNRWGDFLTVRPASGNGTTWVATSFTLQGPCTPSFLFCDNVEPRFVWFGRQRDNPFPSGNRTAADFDGDGKSDIVVWRPTDSNWYAFGQGVIANWGISGDIVALGDYDGIGKTQIAVWRPSDGNWYVYGHGSIAVWGMSGDVPVPGDYDGTGRTQVAVYRPANGNWYFPGRAPVAWGIPGDLPVPADYSGSGKTEIAVWRPSDGNWYVYGRGPIAYWGVPGDVPVPADYSGTGKADVAVWRPSDGNWYVNGRGAVAYWGVNGDIPVPADYDGDGKADVAVFRPSDGHWYLFGQPSVWWGISGDIPAEQVRRTP